MQYKDGFFDRMEPAMGLAFEALAKLELGQIANPDENRMVGHYWLRDPQIAPSQKIRHQIESTVTSIQTFAADVHGRKIVPPQDKRFTDLLIVGIGGSALGPQLVADALGSKRDKMTVRFLDNTDPDGIDRMVETLGTRLKRTLVLVLSKSGRTKETRNGMLEIEHAFGRKNLSFADQAVAVTGEGSQLDQHAAQSGWLRRFPMWDWVGGRTSVMSAVGLLPAALQGVDTTAFLDGAAKMDQCTRLADTRRNPAARLALMWHFATGGRGGSGGKDMVILPYKDRLLLLSRYLQQLVMESLGKEHDLDGQTVHQGISVYGNKGSTDQHAYVQQLRDGLHNFFATFIVVLRDRRPALARQAQEVEPGTTSGDYLNGFWQGTRRALFEKGRGSITITIEKLDARSLGALIALYERSVGIYASLVNINAYHQPGVEAGKKAAAEVLDLQSKVTNYLIDHPGSIDAEKLALALGVPDEAETIHHILQHLNANQRGIVSKRGRSAAW